MRPLRCLLVILLLLPFFAPCPGRAAEPPATIPGTGDSQELLRLLARAFAKSHPGPAIEIPDSIGTSGGIKAVLADRATVARVARPPKEKEQQAQLHYEVFAHSPVVFTTSPTVKGLRGLTYPQITAIYGGRITNWQEIGGPEATIYVMNREEGDSSRTVLEAVIPGFKEITPVGERIYTTPEAVKTLRTYPDTIGYLPLSALRGSGLVPLAVNGVAAREETVRNGRYPLTVPFGFVWKETPQGRVREFLRFIRSEAGRKLLRANGAVPAEQ